MTIKTVAEESYIKVNREKCEFLVNQRVFTDPKILEMEKEKIFDKCWLYLGHVSEVPKPGDYKTRRVGGRELIFNKDSEGKIRVMHNSCPHRGALVCRERKGNSKTFQCFYHAWTFNNKGELIGQPDGEDGYGENYNCDGSKNLRQVARVDQYRGFIFINYDPNAMSLDDYLAGAKEYLDLVADQSELGMEIVQGTQEYNMMANWKLLCENSADGYHAKPTHKTYFEYVIDLNGKPKKGELDGEPLSIARDLGNGHYVTEKRGLYPWGRPVAKWINSWGEEGKKEVDKIKQRLVGRFGEEYARRIAEHDFNMLIFPNLVINNIMAITVRTFYPIAHDNMEVTQWCIGPSEESEFFRDIRLKNFLEFLGPGGFATPDDNEALELCQEGYSNSKEMQWNDISKGMNKELRGEAPKNYDEYHFRVFWSHWNKIMTSD